MKENNNIIKIRLSIRKPTKIYRFKKLQEYTDNNIQYCKFDGEYDVTTNKKQTNELQNIFIKTRMLIVSELRRNKYLPYTYKNL